MATVTIELSSMLSGIVGGTTAISVEADSLSGALTQLTRRYPALEVHLFDETGNLREHVLCMQNQTNSRWLPSLDVPVADGDTITLMQAVSVGELAALGTALCWVFTALAFAAAGRRVGPMAVNVLRLLLAVVILGIIHRLVFGEWVPAIDRTGLWLLGVSGIIGLAIGDQCLFVALVDVGPRVSTLLMTLAPPITALLAWPVLGEPLSLASVLGISVTLSGIAWVVFERTAGVSPRSTRHRRRGITLAAVAGVCQAVGIVLAKLGMGHTRLEASMHVDPWPATLVRMVFAAVAISLFSVLLRAPGSRDAGDSGAGRRRWAVALAMIVLGALLGPVAGVWLSLVAIDLAPAGVAATLMSMSPVFILPFAAWFEGERISRRAVLGAAVAVLGVAILAL